MEPDRVRHILDFMGHSATRPVRPAKPRRPLPQRDNPTGGPAEA